MIFIRFLIIIFIVILILASIRACSRAIKIKSKIMIAIKTTQDRSYSFGIP